MNPRVFAVSLLLFGSGLCALVYQTVWLREFRLIFGASTAATAAVLGIFMGGLGLGSVLLARRCERTKNPLGFYANLELIIAISAAATPFLVTLVRYLYSAAGGSLALGPFFGTVARLLLSALVLAVPTLLMGGTLPAAARSVIGSEDAGRRGLACLYGINTLGAVTGVILSTFFGLELLGNHHTLWAACLLNILVALIARRLSRSFPVPDEAPPAPTTEAPTQKALAPPAFVLTASALVGFAFLLMELVWYRMLNPLLGGSTFTFGLILAVALLGIGLGGALYAVAGQRGGGTLTAFGWTCALEAIFIAIPFALGDRLAILASHLRTLSTVGFSAHIFGWFIIIAIAVLPAAIIAGYQFPLLVALLGRGGQSVATHTARAYALNTVGAISGSLAGGFGLMPFMTAPGLWKLVTIVLAGLSLATLFVGRGRGLIRPFATAAIATVAIGAVGLLFTLGPTAAWRHSGIGAGRSSLNAPSRNALIEQLMLARQRSVWEGDGVESSVSIQATHGASFVVNGKSDGNIRTDAGTQVLGGLIGAALKPDVKTACVIGLGTGSTAGWLARLPEIERVDAMELEPAILHMAKVCELGNLFVLDNPKCHILLGDARELLITGKARYDLVFSEPSNPYRAGIASLFTTEFYETAKERLNPGGLFLQWVQAYEVESDAIRMVLATLAGVFPHVEVWTTQTGDLLLVASAEARTWDAAALRARLQVEPFKTAISRIWGVDSAEGFLSHFVCNSTLPARLARMPDVERNTDDNTLLEFAFARSLGRSGGFRTPELLDAATAMKATRPNITGEVDWAKVDEERLAMFAYNGFPPPTPADLPEDGKVRCEIRRLVDGGRLEEAARLWLKNRSEPLNPRDTAIFAFALANAGSDEAKPFIDRIRATDTGDALVLDTTLLIKKGLYKEAKETLLQAYAAYRNDAWPLPAIQLSANRLLSEIVEADPTTATPFFAALNAGHFPGYLLETHRREMLVRLTLIQQQSGQKYDNSAFARFEPWPTWNRDSLKLRYGFYRTTGLGDAEKALKDYESFLSAEVLPFRRGLLDKEPTAP